MERILRLLAIFVALLCCQNASGYAPMKIGILGFRPIPEEQKKWEALADYLNSTVTGRSFEISVLDYKALESAIASHSVDFVLTNPGHYVIMTHRNGMSSPLATLIPVEHGKALTHFGGVIFTRAENAAIQHMTDLRGKKIAVTSTGSLGGFQSQAMSLHKAGIHLPADAELVLTDMPHDRVVTAVLENKADAGFVRTGVLESMADKGALDTSRIRVINPRQIGDFPFALSTDLYPEWPFAVVPGTDGDIARQVAAALLGLPHDGKLARHLGIRGFDVPADYRPVHTTLQTLRLPPYDAKPEFTIDDIWQKYQIQAIVAIALICLILVLGSLLVILNRRLTHERQREERRAQGWQNFLSALGDGVFGIDSDGRCSFINPAAMQILGITQENVLGKDIHSQFHCACADGTPYPEQDCPVKLTINDGQARQFEECFKTLDGRILPVSMTVSAVDEPGSAQGAVVVFRDISDRKKLEAKLREEATTDPLTRLPNRRYFLDELERHWSRIVRNEEPAAAVMMLDLDKFKNINDTHGHAAGDQVLCQLSALITQSLRRGDLVGRLGGEEFAILQFNASETEAKRLAERIRQSVENIRTPLGTSLLAYTLSIGITLMTSSETTANRALERADEALYVAKGTGRNRVCFKPSS